MTEATTKTTIQCTLASGKAVTLTADDCAAILNAMARRRMLCVMCEDVPAGYSDIWTEECCAWIHDGRGDECVILAANTAEFVEATPIVKKKAPAKRKKAAAKKK